MAKSFMEAGQGPRAHAALRGAAGGAGAASRTSFRAARLPRELSAGLLNAAIPGAGFMLIAVAVTALATSPTLFIADAWPDIFLGLEAALHWAHGHRPHEDFHTPLGAAYVALMGVAGSLADFGPHTLIFANMAMAIFTALVLAAVTFRRLSIPLATLFTVYWTLFALSPRRIGGAFEHVAFLAAYNKWGFALTAGLWLAAILPPRRGGRYAALAETLLLAAALCALFYIKVTFFAAAIAPFLLAALSAGRRPAHRRAPAPAMAGLGMIALIALLPDVNLAAYAQDLLMTARSASMPDLLRLALDVRFNLLLIGVDIIAFILHFRATAAAPEEAAAAGRARSMFLVLLLLALAMNSQNTSAIIPLLAMLPLALAPAGAQDAAADGRSLARLVIILIPVGYCLWWGAVELHAVFHHYDAARRSLGVSFCERSDLALCRVRVTDTNEADPEYDLTFAATRPIHEELYAALDPLVTPRDRIVQFGFFNMLNMRYGLEPARGGMLFWHYRRTFGEDARPPAEAVFADATLVVMNRRPLPNSRDGGMARLYGGHVRDHFVLAAETPNWLIYRRP